MSESTRDRLFEVALDVLAEVGYEGTTTREICKRAGVNIAALNYHWGSKDNLWQTACSWAAKRLIDIGTANLDPTAPPAVSVRRVLTDLFDSLAEDPRPIRIVTWASLQADLFDFRTVAEGFRPFFDFGLAYLKNWVEKGILREDIDYEAFLALYWGQLAVAFIDQPGQRIYFGADYTDPAHRDRIRESLIRSAIASFGLTE